MNMSMTKDTSKYNGSGNTNLTVKVRNNIFYNIYSRILDILASGIGLVIGFPIVIIISIFIKLEDGGPALYKQKRLGKNRKEFYIYKLRSMTINAEKNGMAQWAIKNDPRVTKIGTFIRKTRIDEIPQLFNILKGDMSLIGPRPERPELASEFEKEIPGFMNRLLVKPGLTGLAQVNGGYDITPKEKLVWDLKYIENKSILMDMKILLKTVKVVFTGEGAR